MTSTKHRPTPTIPARITSENTVITSLGPCSVRSPLRLATRAGQGYCTFVSDRGRVRYQVEQGADEEPGDVCFEKAGPRDRLFFDPRRTKAAIVTCGGISPGLNNVIRSAFLELHHNYGVRDVLGLRYGYAGLNPKLAEPPIRLTTEFVDDIHEDGGTVLGSSRGAQPVDVMVEYLGRRKINLLLCVGGDGTLRGAQAIAQEAMKRRVPLAVVGVPKTIDNDVMYVARTFGLTTATDQARAVLDCAHNEARSAFNGVGLVKVMGRDAGFIAAAATLASQEVNFCLIPEVPFVLEGQAGFLETLRRRLQHRRHAVVVVAEGAGQELMQDRPGQTDASGNRRYGDIGVFLKERILAYFKRLSIPVELKYFDPSYFIRSVPANTDDAMLCDQYGRHAVHAGMAGKTNLVIGLWNSVFTHLPIPLAVSTKKRVDPEGPLWMSVLATTGQPRQWTQAGARKRP